MAFLIIFYCIIVRMGVHSKCKENTHMATKKAVDYYDYTGYGDADDCVAVKGIDYDWHHEKVTVSLYVLTYVRNVGWQATDTVKEVSLDYFKKSYKYAGTCYLD